MLTCEVPDRHVSGLQKTDIGDVLRVVAGAGDSLGQGWRELGVHEEIDVAPGHCALSADRQGHGLRRCHT